MYVEGTLEEVFETLFKGNLKIKKFVIKTQDRYPQFLLIELTNDRIGMIDQFKKTDLVKVAFNLKGRQVTHPEGGFKYFNSTEAYRIDKVVVQQAGDEAPVQSRYDEGNF